MASKQTDTTEETSQTPVVDNDTWTTVEEGAPTMVSFDTDGDELIALYAGVKTVTDEKEGKSWNQHLFHAVAGISGVDFEAGELLGVSETYALVKPMQNVPIGHLVRIRRTKTVETGKGNPMISFNVAYKPYAG